MFFKNKHKISFLFTAFVFIVLLFPMQADAAGRLQETGEKTVIVIDPGHGGDNEGTIENNHLEKSMTMITAQAMYDELSLYDDVEVYLTRTDDKKMSLKERAQFAKDKDADFLFSIHYNASANHELFGSEVWVSSFAPYNNYGWQFGHEFLDIMQEKGLFIRGIKTRVDDGVDYYGIIRESVSREIPAVIIEHCHVDEARDEGFCETEEQLIAFGKDDATAVARYFGLKSSALQVDYSAQELADTEGTRPVPITLKDESEPDICQISFADADYETGLLSLTVNAADYDSPLIYYDYSLDGGATFSRREIWPEADALTGTYADTFTLNLQIPPDTKPNVIVRAYNLFDLFLESNPYQSTEIFIESTPVPTVTPDTEADFSVVEPDDIKAALSEDAQQKKEVSVLTFLIICFIFVFSLFVILLISQTIASGKKRKRRRQRRKDAGESRNQHR